MSTFTFKAWAIVNDESGRIMLIDVGSEDARGAVRMESPAIYMTRRAALHHKADNERLVRIQIINAEEP